MAVTVVVSATVAEKVAVRLAGGARGKIEISEHTCFARFLVVSVPAEIGPVLAFTVNDCGPERTDEARGALWPAAASVTSVYVGTLPTCLWQCSCSTITGVFPHGALKDFIISQQPQRRHLLCFQLRDSHSTRPEHPARCLFLPGKIGPPATASGASCSNGQRTPSAVRAAN